MSPTIIFVPGSWHTTFHAEPLLNVLRKRGYQTICLQQASVGLKSPRPTFTDDVELIAQACLGEIKQGRDVMLVLHSIAGICGSEAVNQIIAQGGLENCESKGRLVRVVLIASYALPAGMVFDARQYVGPDDPNLIIDVGTMSLSKVLRI